MSLRRRFPHHQPGSIYMNSIFHFLTLPRISIIRVLLLVPAIDYSGLNSEISKENLLLFQLEDNVYTRIVLDKANYKFNFDEGRICLIFKLITLRVFTLKVDTCVMR